MRLDRLELSWVLNGFYEKDLLGVKNVFVVVLYIESLRAPLPGKDKNPITFSSKRVTDILIDLIGCNNN